MSKIDEAIAAILANLKELQTIIEKRRDYILKSLSKTK